MDKIKDAVFDISQINLLENTIDHLSKIDNFLLKNKKDLGSAVETLRDEVEKNEKALEELKEKRIKLEKDSKEAEIKMTEYSIKLSDTDVGRIRLLQKEKSKLLSRKLPGSKSA